MLSLEKLQSEILTQIKALYARGFHTFLSGMCDGFDLMCARAVMELKDICSDINLVAVIPFSGHQKSFSEEDKQLYKLILEHSSEVIVLEEKYMGAYQYLQRNDFLINNSSLILCYYSGLNGGTRYTYSRGKKLGLEIVNLSPIKPEVQLSISF